MPRSDRGSVGELDRGSNSGPIAFVCTGEYWTIGYSHAQFSLRAIKGLSYIQRLLEHPGQEFHSLDLLSEGVSGDPKTETVAQLRDRPDVSVREPGDAGEMLDDRAKLQYRARLRELAEELEDLRERGAHERVDKIVSEIDFIQHEIARAVGLGGRSRRAGSAAEKARLNVTRSIRTGIQRISEHNSILGELFRISIKTGSFCSYVPNSEDPLTWRFSNEDVDPLAKTGTPPPVSLQEDPSLLGVDQTTFVGREEERAILRRCLQQAKNGEGRVAVIGGPPGIGKTRTAREVGEEARRLGFVALAGNCYDREDSVPFIPFVELLERTLAKAPNIAAIREILGDQAAEMTRLLPQLRRLFPDLPEPLQVSPEQSRRLLFKAVQDLIYRHSVRTPVLLLLEDLHWADEGTLSLLVQLSRSLSKTSLMIIVTHRDDDIDLKSPLVKTLDELSRLRVVDQIRLPGLSQDAVAEMIQILTGREPLPALVDIIYSSTDGNPLFVEELVRQLVQSPSQHEFLELFEQGEIDLPQSLRLAIGRRLELVSKDTVKILGTAAVIGRSFTFALLEAASHADPDRLVDLLEEAENAGLVFSKLEHPEARFKFAHELIRRAVHDELSVVRRQRLHLNIAEAIELLFPTVLEDHAEDLAHHYWSAGTAAPSAKSVRYLQMAGEKAVRSSANVQAISHFRKALQLIGTFPDTPDRLRQELSLHINLGAALIATKGFSTLEVVGVYARARNLSEQVGEAAQLFRILWGQWVNYSSRAEYKTAHELGQQCLEVAQSDGDLVLLVEAHHALGVGYGTTGDFAKALEHLERAVSLYDPERHSAHAYAYGQDPAVMCLIHSGWNLWFLGYPEQALRRNDEGLALAQKLSHPASLATAAAFAAWLEQFCRNSQAVQDLAETAVSLSTQHDFAFSRAIGLLLGGWALTQRGLPESGNRQMRLGLEALQAADAVTMMGYFSGLLAEACGEVGQAEEGLKLLSGVDRNREQYWQAELIRLEGELILKKAVVDRHQRNDRAAEAQHCFRESLALARTQNAKSLELRAAMSLARLCLRQQTPSDASSQLGQIYAWFTEGFDTPDLSEAKALLREMQRL